MNRITTNRYPFKRVSVLKSRPVRSSAIHCAYRRCDESHHYKQRHFQSAPIPKSKMARSRAIHCASPKCDLHYSAYRRCDESHHYKQRHFQSAPIPKSKMARSRAIHCASPKCDLHYSAYRRCDESHHYKQRHFQSAPIPKSKMVRSSAIHCASRKPYGNRGLLLEHSPFSHCFKHNSEKNKHRCTHTQPRRGGMFIETGQNALFSPVGAICGSLKIVQSLVKSK